MTEQFTVIRWEAGEVVLSVKGPNIQIGWVCIWFQYLLQEWNEWWSKHNSDSMRWRLCIKWASIKSLNVEENRSILTTVDVLAAMAFFNSRTERLVVIVDVYCKSILLISLLHSISVFRQSLFRCFFVSLMYFTYTKSLFLPSRPSL